MNKMSDFKSDYDGYALKNKCTYYLAIHAHQTTMA